MNSDPGTAAMQPGDGRLAELRMQSDQAVQAADAAQPLDPKHPPVKDPRDSGVFQPATPATRLQRLVADCTVCGGRTVQDMFELVVGRWVGVRTGSHYRETAAGKTGRRVHFRSCAVCGCMYPADADSTAYVQEKGGEFFNPAKLSPQQRAFAARVRGPRLAGGLSILALILGVVAVFAAPLVWGPIGFLAGLAAYRTQKQKLGAIAMGVAIAGAVIGLALHYSHPFGYG
jgi:hypothetical protein